MGGYRCFSGDEQLREFEGQGGVLLLGVVKVVQVVIKEGFVDGSPWCT